MSGYYISEIAASGRGVRTSAIQFRQGVNIVYGPSNTGKSMIVKIIDYMFGGDGCPANPNKTGYSDFRMRLRDDCGHEVSVARSVECDDDGNERAASKIIVSSNSDVIPSGNYSVKSSGKKSERIDFKSLLLRLIGIEDEVRIVSSQAGKSAALSWRVFFHQFCLKEDYIFTERTIIDNPGYSSITLNLNTLAYLAYEGGLEELQVEDKKMVLAKSEAVRSYIAQRRVPLSMRINEIRSQLDSLPTDPIDEMVLAQELADVSERLSSARREAESIFTGIVQAQSRISQLGSLEERYGQLKSQYESDMNRLDFILDGDKRLGDNAERCPFCDGEIPAEECVSYEEACKAEKVKVAAQLQDLESVLSETHRDFEAELDRLAELERQRDELTIQIEDVLKPDRDNLSEMLEVYKAASSLQAEIEILESLDEEYGQDIRLEMQREADAPKFDAKKLFRDDVFDDLSNLVSSAVERCGYPDFRFAGLNRATFDVTVNGKDKKFEGKGYRGFLNSIFAFVLMKYLDEYGKHAPRMLILDSPILSLKESKQEGVAEGMKSSMLSYMLDQCGNCQVIIVENEIPDDVDFSAANLIEFTKNESIGRCGFLLDQLIL
ncbi:hypothetical protein [Senegalimassilia anaerobia]